MYVFLIHEVDVSRYGLIYAGTQARKMLVATNIFLGASIDEAIPGYINFMY